MAIYGLLPVAEIQFDGFLYPCLDQITNHIGRMRNRSRGRFTCPLVIRVGLPAEAASLLAAYVGLLAKWNRRVNHVSSTEDRILRPLLGEAVWAAGRYPTGSCSHLDIGSGAGFPALPFAILRPDVTFVLLEARARRAAFLETTAYELGLRNVSVVAGRLDRYLHTIATPGPWGWVSWKGIKLDRKELSQLLRTSSRDARLWVFHGADLPLDAQTVKKRLMLNWRGPCPCLRDEVEFVFCERVEDVIREALGIHLNAKPATAAA